MSRAIWKLASHELRLLRRNPRVVFSNVVGLAVIVLLFLSQVPRANESEIAALLIVVLLAASGGAPLSLGVHAFVAEKERRTLESLLLVPVPRMALVAGKLLPCLMVSAAEVSTVLLAAWLTAATGRVPALTRTLATPEVAFVVAVVCPLFSLLYTQCAVIISGRSPDAQTASNMTALVALPVLLILGGAWLGFVTVESGALVFLTLLLVVINLVLMRTAVALLPNEILIGRRGVKV